VPTADEADQLHATPAATGSIAGAETARRAVRLVEVVAASDSPITLDAVATSAQLSRPTTYRLLRVLAEERWLERSGRTEWGVGSRLARLGRNLVQAIDPVTVVQPSLATLAKVSGETACLHLHDGDSALLATGSESENQALRRVAAVGERTPLVRGSAGIAILAHLDTAERGRFIDSVAPVERGALRRRLDETGRRGWASSVGENHPGVAGIAAPVFAGPGGNVIGSISLAGPAGRWTARARREAAAKLVQACAEVSAELAAQRPPASPGR
jgi:DNA-binding IclR family transcriptional regulator